MDVHIPKLYAEYGRYINSSRAFPSIVDGLKPVERKILYAAYLIARNKTVKSARIDGYVIGNLHPHSSVYGTIVQLVLQGFLDGQGNFGCNAGIVPTNASASRYTEVKLSESTLDMAFTYLNYVDKIINELGIEEPAFLPVMFPLCLLGNTFTQGIGFGYRTYIPCFTFQDLKRRLYWLLNPTMMEEPRTRFITNCVIDSPDEEIKKLFTIGKASILVHGEIEETYDFTVIVKSCPPDRKLETVVKKFDEELSRGEIGINDLSTSTSRVVFKVCKSRNKQQIYNDMVSKLKKLLSGTLNFECVVVNEGLDPELVPIDRMLIVTFGKFMDSVRRMVECNLGKIKREMLESEYLLRIREVLPGILKDNSYTINDISRASGIDYEICKSIVDKYKISSLLTIELRKSELENELTKYEKLRQDENLKRFVISHYDALTYY